MRGRLLILSVFLFILLFASPTWAELTCGATIGPSEVVTLTEDLVCSPGGGPPALTVESSSILNLGGHTVNCGNRFRVGIQMNGGGSILQHGTLTACTAGVVVGDDGGHTVTNVTVRNSRFGFTVESNANELSYNTSTTNSVTGYLVIGQGNTFKENLASNNENFGFDQPVANDNTYTKNRAIDTTNADGFRLIGNRTLVSQNLAKGNDNSFGFLLQGNAVQVLQNKAIDNLLGIGLDVGSGYQALGNTAKKNLVGIALNTGAINSQIVGNTAVRNTDTDLADLNDDCDNNEWVGNRFRTADPAECID